MQEFKEPSMVSQTQPLIEADIRDGGSRTIDYFLEQFKIRSEASDDLLALAGSAGEDGLVQVDVGVGGKNMFRVHVSQTPAIQSRGLSIWRLQDGNAQGNMYHIDMFSSNNDPRTVIGGSSPNSMDGYDLAVQPPQLAEYLDEALSILRPHNWRLIAGRENVPEGQV